ncbi:MAG TPA: hypothetical protein O0X61_03245 [Methanocorpusculum sp.]|nr:hypothetical protein [Methanocorpusculum sp.]
MYPAKGYWTDADRNHVEENTLVCVFIGTDMKTVWMIANEVIDALNQNSVLITASKNSVVYYNGI